MFFWLATTNWFEFKRSSFTIVCEVFINCFTLHSDVDQTFMLRSKELLKKNDSFKRIKLQIDILWPSVNVLISLPFVIFQTFIVESSEALATVCSVSFSKDQTLFEWFFSVNLTTPVLMSHTLIVLSQELLAISPSFNWSKPKT